MARFQMQLPTEIMKDFNKIYDNTEQIFGAMTKAGAEVAEKNIKATVPVDEMAQYLKLTRVYRTPSDDGINTKVYFSGYMPFKGGRTSFSRGGYKTTKGIPVDFIAKIFEYGRSTSPFPKKPFMRKAFKKSQIEQAMLQAQKQASGGLLDE